MTRTQSTRQTKQAKRQDAVTAEAKILRRLDAIEARLADVEKIPLLRRELRVVKSFSETQKRERIVEETAEARRAEHGKARSERFEAFVSARLEFGQGRKVTLGHLCAGFVAWADENEVPVLERLHEDELVEAVEALAGVGRAVVLSPVGGKISGLDGVAIVAEHRNENDAPQDDALIQRTARAERKAEGEADTPEPPPD